MAQQIRFTHVIRYVNLDGAVVLLPDDRDVSLLEAQADVEAESIRKEQAKLEELENSDEQKEQRALVAGLQRSLHALNAAIADLRDLLAEHEPNAQVHRFEMHRFSYAERAAAAEEARHFDETTGGMTVDEADYVIAILARTIDQWPWPEPITAEEVGALAPQIVENLYRRIVLESVPSAARLSFRRVDSAGHDQRSRHGGGSPPDTELANVAPGAQGATTS